MVSLEGQLKIYIMNPNNTCVVAHIIVVNCIMQKLIWMYDPGLKRDIHKYNFLRETFIYVKH